MGKLSSILYYVRSGKLLHRIRNRRSIARHNAWQRMIANGVERVDMPVFGKAKLRLYTATGSSMKVYAYDAERDEVAWVYGFLRQGDVFIDIGAHIGYFTVAAADKVGHGGEVHAFEPTPATFVRLEENMAINGYGDRVRLNALALSDSEGSIQLNQHPHNEGYNTIGTVTAAGAIAIEVPMQRFDDYVATAGLGGRIALIKIDVEGWELPALRGGSAVFAADDAPVIMLEFSVMNQRQAGFSADALYNQLRQWGYTLYTGIETEALEPFVMHDAYSDSLNLVAVKQRGRDRLVIQ